MLGRLIADFIVPEERKNAFINLSLMRQGTSLGPRYFHGLKPDGSIFSAEVNSDFIRDIDQQPTKIVYVIRDITKRKQVVEEKAKLQAKLEQIEKLESVGRLAGGVAHDFNNMLGVILGHTNLAMLQTDQSHPVYGHFSKIQQAAQRSAALTQQLLAFARRQAITPQVANINSMITNTLDMLRPLIGQNIEMIWSPGAEPQSVMFDHSQFEQLLVNLCVNARDAITGKGRIGIVTQRLTLGEDYYASNGFLVPGDYVVLTISDNGCGMDKKILSKIFEPFYTTKGVGRGTGLGLATVYGIVKQNNGFINVFSEPGQGTTFKIYLPHHSNSEIAKDGESPTCAFEKTGETILVVEDEGPLLDLDTAMLEGLGYKVLAAGTPTEALHLAKQYGETIDLLMTDVLMPEMNGRQLQQRIQKTNPGLRCLFMSGYTADVISHHGVLDKDVHFIQKPFTLKDMTMKLRETLDEKRQNKG